MSTQPSEEFYKNNVYVQTQNGVFYLDEPDFVIEDIAHALSMCCRFNGHVNQFFSVAQHSLLVSAIMERLEIGDPLEGLMHDATEAYMSDVPAPFKTVLPDWCAIDKKLEQRMREVFRLPLTKSEGCKQADWYALFIEAACLLPNMGQNFQDPFGYREVALNILANEPTTFSPKREVPGALAAAFLERYWKLV